MSATKKETERYYLETFRQVCAEFPPGEIINCEEPDFLIQGSRGGHLGIELTELYHDSDRALPMQAVEKLTDAIVDEACSIHRTAGGPALTVQVEFQLTSKKLGRAQRLDVANKLAALVLETNVEIDASRELENDYDDLTRFPEEVTRIRIQRNRFRSRALWTVPRAAFIPRLHAQLVQHRIDEKNNRSAVYREKSPQVWLVMVHSLHFSLASTFENSREALEHIYCSSFDRTFLLNLFDKQLHELTTYGTP